jgi:hypothetical protein
MARLRIQNPVAVSVFDVFQTSIVSTSATQVVVTNSDGTLTTIVGTGFTFSGGVATGGTMSTITRTSVNGLTTFEIGDQFNAANNSLAAFWTAASGTARFNYISSQDDLLLGSSGADTLPGGTTVPGGENDYTGYQGADLFNGGSGFDYVIYRNEGQAGAMGGVLVNLSGSSQTATITGGTFTRTAGTGVDAYGAIDTYVSIEGASGTNFNDAFFGNNSDFMALPATTRSSAAVGSTH